MFLGFVRLKPVKFQDDSTKMFNIASKPQHRHFDNSTSPQFFFTVCKLFSGALVEGVPTYPSYPSFLLPPYDNTKKYEEKNKQSILVSWALVCSYTVVILHIKSKLQCIALLFYGPLAE